MLQKCRELLGSRKFYAGLIGVLLTYINAQTRFLDDTQIASVAGLIGAWVIGQSVIDSSAKK